MLSAFKAQPIYEVKSRDKAKIESLLAYGDRILAGLNTGALRVFLVKDNGGSSGGDNGTTADSNHDDSDSKDAPPPPPTPTKTKLVDVLREEDKFSKKPVLQLAIVKEANLLVSLSDAYVSLHDLQTYELVERLERTKGATCFAVTSNVVKDPETNVPGLVSRLAVGAKRKILCWTWQDMELLPEVADISLEASIKSLIWADGSHLVAGMDPGFSTVDISTHEITPISKRVANAATDASSGELAGVRFGAVSSSGMGYMGMGSWVPKPMATGLSGDQVLLAKDVNTLFVTVDGRPLEKRQVPWALAPEQIGFSYPYLLALQPPDKGTLQIRNPETLSLLQTVSVPGATILHVPQPYISLAHAGKGFLVASDRTIWRMNALSYPDQLSELVAKQRFDEAISLLELLEDTLIDDKAGRIREMMSQKGIALFHQQKYLAARDLFTDAQATPERVIALYPRIIAGELSAIREDASELEPAENGDAKTQDASKIPPVTPVKGMFGKITGGHKKGEQDATSIKSPARHDTDNISVRTKTTKVADRPLEGDDLKFAARCLHGFLAQARTQVQAFLNYDGTLKQDPPSFDNETGKPAFSNLLSHEVLQKGSDAVDWQAELLRVAKLVDTTLFRAYMLATPTLAGSLFRVDNFCDPEVVQAALYEGERYSELIDFLHGKKLHRQALELLVKFGKDQAEGDVPEAMRGPERTVGYLKQLPPELVDLVLEYAQWPLEEKPDVGMDVFIADTDNAERLPRRQVVEFLAGTDEKLEIRYLEHIINELGDDNGDFHQRLIDLYLVELKKADLEESYHHALKANLEAFLLKSPSYSKRKTFQQLPADSSTFFEARAIVLCAMGNHKQALSIYVFQIKDYLKAEEYCNKIYLEDKAEQEACLLNTAAKHEKHFRQVEPKETDEKSNIYAVLLGLYLRPPAGEEKQWPQALNLLSKHGSRLPASSTLDLMPDDLAIRELHDYFRGRIRNATSISREEMIVRGLESVRRVNTEKMLLLGPDRLGREKPLGKNRRVRIGEDDHCKVCHKRFGASAVRVYPDNEVIHYGCIGRSGNKRMLAGDGMPNARRTGMGWT
ncbi:Putative vacuolar sorting protein 39/Transforming growth factor beta receptor-associated domain 1 [Septoria linicola]|uniref:Vacuolar sorting protein 39/Transforming growth factor beta receptor-associated domain 1 n=1 Tax=Septoria linicola TaxID=215465 RepID=A0A9Q9ADG6_9PEZI|nr:putative vacuolar sorting protein 39/Transforming growth factor beta receptor-associated domain 1 [Septoria linicola]USW47524.1 Putative vacuolar sorting protein 39/Transforming growth factor beta receptor-associated domain 1 [Septoria linicola]